MKILILATIAGSLIVSYAEAMPYSEAYAIVAKQIADAKAEGFDGFCGSSPILPAFGIPMGWSTSEDGVIKGPQGRVIIEILSKDSFWELSCKFGENPTSIILLSYFISDKQVVVYRGYPAGEGESFDSNSRFLRAQLSPQPVEQGAAANP